MAISFVSSFVTSMISGADPSIPLSGFGLQQNDVLVYCGGIGDNDGIDFTLSSLTSGYTKVADLFADDTQDCNLGVFWKAMGATPDSSVAFDGQGGADASCGAIAFAFRGVDPTNPMDVTPVTVTTLNTMQVDPASIDHNNPSGVWTLICGASAVTSRASRSTYTFPTGYTVNARNTGATDTTDLVMGMAYRSSGVSDPENPGTMTLSGTDNAGFSCAAVTIALRPSVESLAQTFVIFPARTDGVGHGGIFPSNRLEYVV